MNKRLFGLGAALGLTTALVIPPELSAAPFALGSNVPGYVRDDLLQVHCCHSHPRPPYDQYCCHPGGAAVVEKSGIKIKAARESSLLLKRPNDLYIHAEGEDGSATTIVRWLEPNLVAA